MRVMIVDDERPARERLRRLLALETDVSSVTEARDGVEALDLIARERPDVVLLDIQMPEVSGLELAASLPAPAPLVVFVTAYDQHAVAAFDANAIDYLLKPFDHARLCRALARVRARLAQAAPPAPDTPTAPALATQPVRQLLIAERGVTRIVPVAQIQWLETADNYVVLHTAAGQPLMRQTLAGLLLQLGAPFVRCHRRAAVQLTWVEALLPLDKGDGALLLRGGARVPCSRQYRASVLDALRGAPQQR